MEQRKRRFQVASSVRAELERQHVSPEALADAAGMDLSDLDNRLTGDIAFDVEELEAIARALGVAVDSLLSDGT